MEPSVSLSAHVKRLLSKLAALWELTELVDGYQPMELMLLNARNSEPALMLFPLIKLLVWLMDLNVSLTERNVLTKEPALATPLRLLVTLVEPTEHASSPQMLAD
jgi:hypothetical protein